MDASTDDPYEGWDFSPDPMFDHLVISRRPYMLRLEKRMVCLLISMPSEPCVDFGSAA